MGLDMYLNANIVASKTSGIMPYEKFYRELKKSTRAYFYGSQDMLAISIKYPIIYWRKANQIHNWFVTNIQNGIDDCKSYYVEKEKIMELYELVKKVRKTEDPTLLPRVDGCFFGSTDIDDAYWFDIDYTIQEIERLLAIPEGNYSYLTYRSSW